MRGNAPHIVGTDYRAWHFHMLSYPSSVSAGRDSLMDQIKSVARHFLSHLSSDKSRLLCTVPIYCPYGGFRIN